MLALRSWRTAGLFVFAAGLAGAVGAVVFLALLSLVTSGTLKYVGSEAWLIFPLAGLAILGLPTAFIAITTVLLGRRRARRVTAA